MSFLRAQILTFGLLLGAVLPAVAGSGGSTYSVLGLGDLRYMPGTRSAGMGYTGIALTSLQYINPDAPATWARINRMRINAGMLYEGFNTKDARISRYLSSMNFAGAMMAIPVSPSNGIVFGAGFTPYSNVDYNFVTSGTHLSGTDRLDYTLRHVGTGGLGQAELGLSWGPTEIWSLGASLNYVFGSIDNAMTMVTTQTSVATGTATQTANLHGLLGNVGLTYSGFGGALRPLSVGVTMTTPGSFQESRDKTFQYSGGGQSSTEFDTLKLSDGKIEVPLALGVGLAWAASERLTFAADFRTQAWGGSKFFGEAPTNIRNSQMFGVGLERAGSRDASTSFWDHLALRLGFNYDQTYYEVRGVAINAWLGTAGISVPISGESRLDFSVEYGARGKISNDLVKENLFRFSVSLNLGEAWFVRPEED